MKLPWIEHPRSKTPDTMLTLAVAATASAILKFLVNGVVIGTVNLGSVDAALIGALLIPTLGSYVGRKYTDSPDKKETK